MRKLGIILKYCSPTIAFLALMAWIAGASGLVLTIEGNEVPLIRSGMAIALISLGGLLYIYGWILVKNHPPVAIEQIADSQIDLSFLPLAAAKTRIGYLVGGVMFFVLGACVFWFVGFIEYEEGFISDFDVDKVLDWVISIVLLAFAIAGVAIIRMGFSYLFIFRRLTNFRESTEYNTILKEPQKVDRMLLIHTVSKYAGLQSQMETEFGRTLRVSIWAGKENLVAGIILPEQKVNLLIQYFKSHNPGFEVTTQQLQL